jgi:hypothetical protein
MMIASHLVSGTPTAALTERLLRGREPRERRSAAGRSHR